MRRWQVLLTTSFALAAGLAIAQKSERGIRLEDRSWWDAEAALHADAVVVVPLGAGAKEHGPHLPMRTDLTIAEHFARHAADAADVVVAPPVTYDHDPAFVDYPGSASLTPEAERDLVVEVVRSLARFGPRRFYVLNAGSSTARPLQMAARELATDGILMRYTDYAAALDAAATKIRQQPGGAHADEIETSLMLHVAPQSVDMKRAVKEYYHVEPEAPFRLSRQRVADAFYSPSGVWGDPTLATAQKGAALADALMKRILDDIAALRAATPPAASPAQPHAAPAAPRPSASPAPQKPGECSGGDLRTIKAVAAAYTYRWSVADAEKFAALWAPQGDIVHLDGSVERTPTVIMINRIALFARQEYRNSKHPLDLLMIRCPDPDIAIADGKWQMIGVRDASGKELPPFDGQATLVFRRLGDGWLIEAYRYTMKEKTTPPPIFLKRPGWPGKDR